jgi:hypothetical protein
MTWSTNKLANNESIPNELRMSHEPQIILSTIESQVH